MARKSRLLPSGIDRRLAELDRLVKEKWGSRRALGPRIGRSTNVLQDWLSKNRWPARDELIICRALGVAEDYFTVFPNSHNEFSAVPAPLPPALLSSNLKHVLQEIAQDLQTAQKNAVTVQSSLTYALTGMDTLLKSLRHVRPIPEASTEVSAIMRFIRDNADILTRYKRFAENTLPFSPKVPDPKGSGKMSPQQKKIP